MKNSYWRYLIFSFFALSHLLNAQWYFETGLTASDFDNFESIQDNGNEDLTTSFVPQTGLRDVSYELGYLFSFSKKYASGKTARTPFFRMGMGLGFDQINIRTNAYFNQVSSPSNINYHMAQLQANANIVLTPMVIYTKKGLAGKQPLFTLNVHGGAGYNQFTSVIMQNSISSVDLLAAGNEFTPNYISIHYGAGVQLFFNKYTQLYLRHSIIGSQDINETTVNGGAITKRTYSYKRNKFSIGLLFDISGANKYKKQQYDAIKALDAQTKAGDTAELLASVERLNQQSASHFKQISVLNVALAQLKAGIPPVNETNDDDAEEIDENSQEDIADNSEGGSADNSFESVDAIFLDEVDETFLDAEIHETGIVYFPEFTHVNFNVNSSYFEVNEYKELFSKLARFLEDNPTLKIQLIGYADPSGPDLYNLQISKNRAVRVRDYLVQEYGISIDRIDCVAAGVTDSFGVADPQHNRRTEIVIMK